MMTTEERTAIEKALLTGDMGDLELMKHGSWEERNIFSSSLLFRNRETMLSEKCSYCNRWNTRMTSVIPANYCPHCGAKMG